MKTLEEILETIENEEILKKIAALEIELKNETDDKKLKRIETKLKILDALEAKNFPFKSEGDEHTFEEQCYCVIRKINIYHKVTKCELIKKDYCDIIMKVYFDDRIGIAQIGRHRTTICYNNNTQEKNSWISSKNESYSNDEIYKEIK